MAAAKTMRIGVFEQMRRGALQNSGLSDVIRGMFCGDPTMVMAYRDCCNQITLDEQAVWIAVIEQAAMDLCAPESSPKWRNAFAWIGTPDFSHVCDLAMLSPAGIARGLRSKRMAEEETVKRIGIYWYNRLEKEPNKFMFGSSRTPSIKQFLKHLTEAEILEAIDIALGKFYWATSDSDSKPWRYFCGICWRTIRRAQGEEV